MKSEIRELWVKALRSGEYQQATGQLMALDDSGEPEGYCCLGVLCDLYSRVKEVPWDGEAFLGCHSFPHSDVRDWAEMDGDEWMGVFGNKDVVSMNDNKGTFSEIADVIERLG